MRMAAEITAASAGVAPEPDASTQAVDVRGGSLSIRAEGLNKTYGAFRALDNVSLDVRAGEFLTLLGPSGSGKTTLLNIVAGFLRPDSGGLWFGPDDVTDLPVHERGLGMVFQNYALFPHMNVFDNVAFPLRVRKLTRSEIDVRVRQVLGLVQLDHLAARSISALSGGQRQRVALARAVVFSPRIVLMDEPLSALDKNLREQMQVEIRHLHQRIGATTIYVTHDQREALTMSDRVAVMNLGRLVQCATPAEIYEHPANAFVAGFIGETALVDVTAGPAGEVMMADGTRLAVAAKLPAGALVLALRAERLLLPGEYGDDCNRIPARLREVIYQGDSLLLLAEIAKSQTVSIRKPLRGPPGAAQPWRAGDAIALGLSPASTIVVPR